MNQVEVRRRQLQAVSMILTLLTLAVVARLTGYNGAAYVASAVETLTAAWLMVSGGVTDTLGRLIRSRNSKGQGRNAARLSRNVFILQAFFGLAGSLLLLAGADWISRSVFRIPYGTFILMVMSPALFLRSISAVLLGYFQGEGTEMPRAAAGILRQLLILGFGLLFGKMLGEYGGKVSRLLAEESFSSMYGGVGIGIAVTVSELFIVLFLGLLYRGSRRGRGNVSLEGMRSADSLLDSARALYAGRGWQWLTNLLLFLPIPLGFVFFGKSGAGQEQAAQYGAYVAVYWVLCGICAALILIVLLPLCGRAVSCLRKDEQRFARTIFQSGVHMSVVHGIYCFAFLAVMASQLAGAFGAGQEDAVRKMMQGGSVAVLLLALSLFFLRFLNMTGNKIPALGAVGAADVVYVISATALLNTGRAGILSLVYAGLLGLGVLCVLLGALAFRQIRVQPDWLRSFLLPAGCAVVMGLVCTLLGRVLTPHLGNAVTLVVAFVVSMALYWAALLLLRSFREQELETIPGGRVLRSLGQMLRVF